MKVHRLLIFVLLALMAAVVPSIVTRACPMGCCLFRTPVTLSHQLANAVAVALAERVSGDAQAKQTTFVIRHLDGDESEELNVGDSISMPYFSKDELPGMQLLLGVRNQAGPLEWKSVGAATEDRLKYILEAPRPNVAAIERLPYFLPFLESTDPLIAADAYLEVDSAEWSVLLAYTAQLPRDKLREWLRKPETPANRRGLYAKLLGICGNRSDAEFFLAHICQPTDDFRLEMEGYNIAYLWRKGEKGLAVLDELGRRFSNRPFSERYASMQAIRFMVTHGAERITRERACASMRPLLDDPELTNLVIADLARWKDWSVQDKVMSLYGQDGYQHPGIKRAIVRYLFAAGQIRAPFSRDPQKLTVDLSSSEQAPHVLQARAHLERLCTLDLKTVQLVERFSLLK